MNFAAKDIYTVVIFHLPLFVILISSCNNQAQFRNQVESLKPAYSAPDTVLLDTMPPAKKVWLETAPTPLIVKVPKTTGSFYTVHSEKGEQKIPLAQPVIIKAKTPQANFTYFNNGQTLGLNSVRSGMLDKKGRLWFGNPAGVCYYDGTRFTGFTTEQGLTNGTIRCIIEDKQGNMWFGSQEGGVSRYNGTRFTTFTTRDGLADNFVLSILEDRKGNIWFGTNNGGISWFDGNRIQPLHNNARLESIPINAIEEDKNGNLWFGTYGGGLHRYEPAKRDSGWTVFTSQQGLAGNFIWCIYEDTKGNIWVGTSEEGLSRFDGTGFTTFTARQGLADNKVYSITEDKTGNIWIGTSGGLTRYDGKKFVPLAKEQGLSGNDINCLIEDKTGNIWIGTEGGGINCYQGNNFSIFTSNQGLAGNNVYGLAEDEAGNLWFAPFGRGVYKYDGAYFTNFTTSQGMGNNTVFCIQKDSKGNLWFGTYEGGVIKYDGNNFTTFTSTQGLGENSVASILEDRSGNLWFGTTEAGVSCFDGKSFKTFSVSQGLAHNTVMTMAEDDSGNLWFGTGGGGVSRYDGNRFINYDVDQGLAHNFITGSFKDRSGNLWFGTAGGGVSRYDGSGFISLTTSDGLGDNYLYNILEDEDGVIWMGTNKGFSGLKFNIGGDKKEIKGAGLLNISNDELRTHEPVWEIYNNSTGYPVKDLNAQAMCITKKMLPFGNKDDVGVIWGGCGDEKVIRFDPKSVSKNTEQPNVFIQSVKIDEASLNWYSLGHIGRDSTLIAQQEAMVYGKLLAATVRDSLQKKFRDIKFDSITPYYPLPLNLVLPYKHNRVSIDFGAIETSRNFMVRYQYILEGYDNEWNPVTEKTSASFGNISEGSYTFKLKAMSPEGIWSEPISYHFKVLPPWWRTWWFRTLIGISFLFLLYGIYRWRTATLRQQKRKLEQTVKERTSELLEEKEKSDELLLNILPSEVAEELKQKGHTTAKAFDEVTILFSDIKGFTNIAEKMTAQELVKEIDTYFSAFDNIMQQYGLEKIKTIGDAYIAAGGIPEKNSATPQNVIEAAIAMQQTVEKLKKERISLNKPYFELRIGIHTGPVVAGVVGIKKFQYDIWGDTVNLAARMEQSGVPGKINISQHTYGLVKEQFTCVHRGKIDAKNKGEIDMYFVE